MNIRYQKVIEPGVPVVCVGRLDQNRRGKLFLASAELTVNDEPVASGSAKFFPLKGDQETMLQSEFGDRWQEVLSAMQKFGNTSAV